MPTCVDVLLHEQLLASADPFAVPADRLSVLASQYAEVLLDGDGWYGCTSADRSLVDDARSELGEVVFSTLLLEADGLAAVVGVFLSLGAAHALVSGDPRFARAAAALPAPNPAAAVLADSLAQGEVALSLGDLELLVEVTDAALAVFAAVYPLYVRALLRSGRLLSAHSAWSANRSAVVAGERGYFDGLRLVLESCRVDAFEELEVRRALRSASEV